MVKKEMKKRIKLKINHAYRFFSFLTFFRNRNKNESSTVFGCFYIFSRLYKVFSRHKATSIEQSLSSENFIMAYVAEGKCQGFLSSGMLKLNLV